MTARSPPFDDVNAAALAAYPGLLSQWFPNGHLCGREFRVGNLQGESGESLSVNIRTGVWRDFASDDGGSDPVSLFAAINGLLQVEAKNRLAVDLGLSSGARRRVSCRREISTPVHQRTGSEANTPIVRGIWSETIPLQNTIGAYHLTCRGITITDFSDVRFHPNCFHELERRTYPAIVAAVRNCHDEIVAVQRIYLANDGRDRAEIEKQKLCKGPIRGNAVRLTAVARILQLCESVEDGLALLQMTDRATWALPGAGNLGSFKPPPEVSELVLSPDHDKPGLEAIDATIKASVNRCPKFRRLLPPVGKDWCDVLGTVEERAGIREFNGEQDRETAETQSWVEAFCNDD